MEEQKQKTQNLPEEPAASQDNPMFYNVMPRVKSRGVVMPTLQSSTKPIETPKEDTAPAEPAGPSFFARFKLYIILLILLVILAPIGYFLIPKYFGGYEEENFLVEQPIGTQKTGDAKKDWLIKYFGKIDCGLEICGDEIDADRDGLTNLREFEMKTDPNNPDSDKDGLADGDEVKIFISDPLNDHSGVNSQYTDSEFVKNGYDLKTDKKYSAAELVALHDKMKEFGLHQPTVATLEGPLLQIYKFDQSTTTASTTPPITKPATTTPTSTLPKDLNVSPEAMQDRDTQRSLTIKNIGIALIKYFDDNKLFPAGGDFKQMHDSVKPYLKTASNPSDPINAEKFVYTYTANSEKTDFTLSYFSETLNMLIKKTAKDARADKAKLEAAAFDDQRRGDLDAIRSALLVYSADNIGGNEEYVFPTKEKYSTALVPRYMSSIPKDPKTLASYEYLVSETFDTFTLKTMLDAPSAGKTGYLCNQVECNDY